MIVRHEAQITAVFFGGHEAEHTVMQPHQHSRGADGLGDSEALAAGVDVDLLADGPRWIPPVGFSREGGASEQQEREEGQVEVMLVPRVLLEAQEGLAEEEAVVAV